MAAKPDLLHLEPPEEGGPGPDLHRALTFAYTTGGPQAAFDRTGDSAHEADASWHRASFADQLFLPQLVERCMPLPPEVARSAIRPGRAASLVAVLCRPPA